MTDSEWDQPKEAGGLMMVFGAAGNLSTYLPAKKDIPEEFWRGNTKWNQLTSEWFFQGLNGKFVPKPGINLSTALRHLKTIMGSFEPQHEHKEAGVSYLMSLWFDDFVRNEKDKN